jgi:diguanylate cyclase (GGDEF)-like protein
MTGRATHRMIVLALALATVGAAILAHLAAANSLRQRRTHHLDAAYQQVVGALRGQAFYLSDVADMVGVHDDADAAEFSRYAHIRGRDETAVVSVQWVRRPVSRLQPPASTGPAPLLVKPADGGNAALAHVTEQAASRSALERASANKQDGVSRPIQLADGHPGFYLAVPVQARSYSGLVSRAESRSAVVGLIDAQKMIGQAIDRTITPAVRVSDGDVAIGGIGAAPDHRRSKSVSAAGRRWTLTVDGGTLTRLERLTPWVIVVLGFALTIAVALVLRSAARRRDDALKLADERLQDLVATLNRVEQTNVELASAHADADRLSREDALTAIYNRRHFGEALAEELARERDDGLQAAVLLLDLDHFKMVNDEHGHLTGDAVLRTVAARLQNVLRSSDTLARWGGEEFAILAPGMTRDTTTELGDRARDAISSQPIVVGGASFTLRVSVGAALTGADLDTPDLVVAAADQALYAAKRAGRDRTRTHPVA